jgi:hypothetical protein
MMDKFTGYILNQSHPTGKHKARVFRAIGFTQETCALLVEQIYQAVQREQAELFDVTAYCTLYNVLVPIVTSTESVTVLTAWCIPHNSPIPHLTTAYIV